MCTLMSIRMRVLCHAQGFPKNNNTALICHNLHNQCSRRGFALQCFSLSRFLIASISLAEAFSSILEVALVATSIMHLVDSSTDEFYTSQLQDLSVLIVAFIGERERANLVVHLAAIFYRRCTYRNSNSTTTRA